MKAKAIDKDGIEELIHRLESKKKIALEYGLTQFAMGIENALDELKLVIKRWGK